MIKQKESFLKTEFIPLLKKLKADDKGKWGVMNAHQMAEHLIDAVKNANGKLSLPILNEGETLEKYRAFLLSENPMREDTKNPLMPEIPAAVRSANITAAINLLQQELDHFFEVYDQNPHLELNNPFFGKLNYSMQIQLLHKHGMHHLKQFNLV